MTSKVMTSTHAIISLPCAKYNMTWFSPSCCHNNSRQGDVSLYLATEHRSKHYCLGQEDFKRIFTAIQKV